MSRPEAAERMLDFLRRQVIFDPGVAIDASTPLVSSGLVDSFALVEVLLELERVTERKIPAGRVAPLDLDTVEKMLALAERLAPRKKHVAEDLET